MATSEMVKVVTLTLSKKEADYLQALLQNPVGCTPAEEDPELKQKRESIFGALKVKETS